MREIEPSLVGIPEMGWVFLPQFHGRGFAREAVEAAQQWGAKHLSSKRPCCIIDLQNTRSIRLAQKCGFRELQRTVYHHEPIMVFIHEASATR
jgi:RimJ/RimL family protein N-acetyltransferase